MAYSSGGAAAAPEKTASSPCLVTAWENAAANCGLLANKGLPGASEST